MRPIPIVAALKSNDVPVRMNDPSLAPPASTYRHPLVAGPILPTLLRLALPTTVATTGTTLVGIAETSYVGRLGTEPLAAMALVFPMVMLMQMMSSGAMGGGAASAVSRALGTGDEERANALAVHALVIGLLAGLGFSALFLTLGPQLYYLMGGRGGVLAQSVAYSNTVFLGAVCVWLLNTMASLIRGTGNMLVPSATIFLVAALQIGIGGALGLGLGPFPRLGMPGIALGQVVAFTCGALVLLRFLLRPRGRLTLRLRGVALRRAMFFDILKVGGPACLSPLQSVLVMLVFASLVARFGTQALAGYGIGARLEFLLMPLAVSIGVASVPMVGMAIGAGEVARARRVAWTAAALAATVLGSMGILAAIFPDLWAGLFTDDSAVLDAARQYLRWAGPGFLFFGVGIGLFFASQGAGNVLGPVMASTARLVIIAIAGWGVMSTGAPLWGLFAVAGIGTTAYGLLAAVMVYRTRWKPQDFPR